MTKMRKTIFTTMLLLFLSSVVYSADWKSFGSDANNNEWFCDTQSISREEDTTIVRTKVVLSDKGKTIYIKNNPYIANIKKISYILDRVEINCSKNIIRPLSSFWYSSEGYEVLSVYYSKSQFKQIVPDSIEVRLAEIGCQEEIIQP